MFGNNFLSKIEYGHQLLVVHNINSHPILLLMNSGQDAKVILWSVDDKITSIVEPPNYRVGPRLGYSNYEPRVTPRGIFRGHTNTVEDVEFNPIKYVYSLTHTQNWSGLNN